MKQKGFAPILIILILAAVLLSGYFIYQKQTKPISSPEPSPLSTEAPAKVEDPTANWETYTNTKYGYSFKYPTNLSIKENIDQDVFVDNNFIRVVPVPQQYDKTHSENITQEELETAQKAPLNEYFINPVTKREFRKIGEQMIDGVLFTKLKWQVFGDLQGNKSSYSGGLVGIVGNNLYILPANDSYPVPQVLSTFKFTN